MGGGWGGWRAGQGEEDGREHARRNSSNRRRCTIGSRRINGGSYDGTTKRISIDSRHNLRASNKEGFVFACVARARARLFWHAGVYMQRGDHHLLSAAVTPRIVGEKVGFGGGVGGDKSPW